MKQTCTVRICNQCKVSIRYFTNPLKNWGYYAHAQTVCTRPLLRGEGAGDEATVRAELATTNLESSKLDFQVVSEPGPIRPIPGYATGLRYIDLT